MRSSVPGEAGSERRTFQIHSCLGRGGFGEVYRATMESSGGVATEVAVKVLRSDINPGSDSVKRLRDEGRLLGKLSHPSIVKVHDLVILDGRVSLVTEFIEGEDLDQCFKGAERLPARALVMAIGEVASALNAAWASPSHISGEPLRLIHRDVKPANIRIGRHGEVKLLDFGIARAGNAVREAQTAANAMMGSYLYMAPERFHEDAIDTPSDIFALGSVLYEGLAGERFFGGMSLQQVYAFMLSPNRFKRRLDERLAELSLDAPEPVLELVRVMMAPDPDERPTAQEIATECEDIAEELTGDTLKRWCRKRAWPESDEMFGSLDGRVLSAGTVGTMEPPVMRGRAPRVAGHSYPDGSFPSQPAYTPPGPAAVPPPQPQMLGSHPSMPGEPVLPSRPAQSDSLHGEPGLGDFSQARADVAAAGPGFSFGEAAIGEEDTDLEDAIEAQRSKRRMWNLMLAAGAVALVLVCGIGLAGAYVLQHPDEFGLPGSGKPIADVAVDQPAPEPAGDEVVEAADPALDGEGTPDVDGTDAPEPDGEPGADTPPEEPDAAPAPVEEPKPAPEPTGPTASSLSKKGWDSMGTPDVAVDFFVQALLLDKSSGEATFGHGYALVKLDRKDEGRGQLCKALGMVDGGTKAEINGFLQQNDLSCD